MKKKMYTIIVIILLLVLLLPVPLSYKDGGTTEYKAVLYSIYNYHAIWYEEGHFSEEEYRGFLVGSVVEVFGIEVYNNTRFESQHFQ